MKKERFLVVGVLLLVMISGGVKAQQFPLYSQYYQNLYIINPGIVGAIGEYTPIRLSIHKQWLGIDNSPSTQYLSGHHQLEGKSVGIGGMIFHDKFGPVETLGANFTYGYHLKVNDGVKLGLGLSAMLMHYRIKLSQDDFYGYEPILIADNLQVVVPDADFGALLYHKKYWAGFSVKNLFQSQMKLTSNWESKANYLARHYFFTAGYKIKFPYTRNFRLIPSILIKATQVTPIQTDINVKLEFYQDFWLGLSVRANDSFVAMVGFTYDKYYFAISHDFTFSDLSNVTNGSEELTFGWNIHDSRIRQRSYFE